MPRNMSFALTTGQVRNQTKTVTRRSGWSWLQPGTVINACVKCMGLKKGESVEKLGQILVTSVRREPLSAIRNEPKGASAEGFPDFSAEQFIAMFCKHMGGNESQEVTRIEFEYIGNLR